MELKELIKFVASKKIRDERRSICESCEKMQKNIVGIPSCNECGCFIESMITYKGKSCPLHKWPEVE